MLTAIQKDNKKINAFDIDKTEAPFFCPFCGENVILKKGLIKTHHFAHKATLGCFFNSGESEIHLQGKKIIYDFLKRDTSCLEISLEKILGNVIADIFVKYKNYSLAVEIQRSNISLNQLIFL